jgi:NAD(P)-dependent dehydrogenase (short-subunit alcohol dehydrogenase family)
MTFVGKVALVTGAGGGIGLASAKAFAEAGAAVVIVDRDSKLAANAEANLRAAGHNATALTCDVADAGQVAKMMAHVVTTYVSLRRRPPGGEQPVSLSSDLTV